MATGSVTAAELFNLIENGVLDNDDDEMMKSDSDDDEMMKSDQEDSDYKPEASDSSDGSDTVLGRDNTAMQHDNPSVYGQTVGEVQQDNPPVAEPAVGEGQQANPPIAEQEVAINPPLAQEQPTRGKKRRRNPKTWQKNVRKQKKNSGIEYVSIKKKVVQPAAMGRPCTCTKKCFDQLGENADATFKAFWKIGDKDLQDSALFAGMKCIPVKRKRPRTGQRTDTTRACQNTFIYSVKLPDGTSLELCKKAFMSVHGIGKKRFERIQKHAGSGIASPRDQRGKHNNHPTVGQNIKDQVNEHIRSFPKRQSHYSRHKNPNRYYLHENLTMRRMWLMYLHMYEPAELDKLRRKEKVTPKVKYWLYCDIFTKENNLSFGSPRSDTCNTCDKLQNEITFAEKQGNMDNQNALKQQLDFHHRKAEKGYAMLNAFKEKARAGELDMLTFDFQQNLPVPTLRNTDMFYARLLWTYNFGIHNCADDSACMHLWSESEAKRGSSEVCSCLEHYLDTHESRTRHLVLFTDGCGGQNKNKIMFAYLLRLIKLKKFDRIDHFFLTRGHTFLPNDRDFGVIEKFKRGEMAYVPKNYAGIIERARTSNPFETVYMQTQDLSDYMAFSRGNLKTAMLKDVNSNTNTKIRSIMWYSYGKSEVRNVEEGTLSLVEHQDEIWGRYTLNELENWLRFQPLKQLNDLTTNVEAKYAENPVQIKHAKYKDLIEKIVNKGVLPEEHRLFFTQLPHVGPDVPVVGRVGGDESDEESDTDDYVY